MFEKILVPVDPSEREFADLALKYAAQYCNRDGSKVCLVSVLPVMPGVVTEYLPADYEDKAGQEAVDTLRSMAASYGMNMDQVTCKVRIGGVYHEVLDEGEMWGADLIVMTSHRPAMSTYLLGSNAAKIVRHAKCSVTVLRT